MKTLRKILDRLLRLLFITVCYAMDLWTATGFAPDAGGPARRPIPPPEAAPLPARGQGPDKFLQFSSSAVGGALLNAGCGSGGGFLHPSKPLPGNYAPMGDAIAPMGAPFSPM